MQTKYLIILLLFICNYHFAQLIPEIKWVKMYSGGSGRDRVNETIIDTDFSIYQAGMSANSFIFLKYSNTGSLSYMRLLPDEGSISEAKSISVKTNGDLYVCGTNSINGSSLRNGILYKFSSSYDKLWTKEYSNYSDAVQVVLDKYEQPVIGIQFENGVMISKYSDEGDSIWTYQATNDNSTYEINLLVSDALGNIYTHITREYWESGDVPEHDDVFLKININGEVIWNKNFRVSELIFDNDDNLLVYSIGERKLSKVNPSGEIIWEYESIGLLTDVAVDSNNDIILTGFTGGISSIDFVTTKITTSGSKVWENVQNCPEDRDDFLNSVAIDSLNNVYVTGIAHDMFSDDITYILKYSDDGEELWEFRYDAPHSTFQNLNEIFTDDSGNIFIAGEIIDSTTGNNFYAIKIGQELGSSVSNDGKFPTQHILQQNYPNPFNPSTTIKYQIQANLPTNKAGVKGEMVNVTLKVYDVLGREVVTLVNKAQRPGNYEVTFNANSFSSGVYYYQLKVAGFIKTKKMILLK